MDAFIGEIRAFPYRFAPQGWLECAGQSLTVAQYQPLFAVIRTAFGGDGKTTFNLPDMRGLAAVGAGDSAHGRPFRVGQPVGTGAVRLSIGEIPPHNHTLNTQANPSVTGTPDARVIPTDPRSLSESGAAGRYAGYAAPSAAQTPMAQDSLLAAGADQAHDNHSPYLVFLWCIATEGTYPVVPD